MAKIKGRVFSYDQDKVKELRMSVIMASLEIMQDKPSTKNWSQLKKDLILKIAPRVLPTLTELTGADGKPLFDAQTRSKTTEAIGSYLAEDSEQGGQE